MLAEAERYLTRNKVRHDKVEFVCRLEDPTWDALCYVWDGKSARALKIRVLDGSDAPAGTPAEVPVMAPPETEPAQENADVPDFIRAA